MHIKQREKNCSARSSNFSLVRTSRSCSRGSSASMTVTRSSLPLSGNRRLRVKNIRPSAKATLAASSSCPPPRYTTSNPRARSFLANFPVVRSARNFIAILVILSLHRRRVKRPLLPHGARDRKPHDGPFQESPGKSHILRHSGKSRNPELLENPGFRVALRLPGMTASPSFEGFEKRLWRQKNLDGFKRRRRED